MYFKKNIFQVWLQGYKNIEKKEFLNNVENWKNLNKDWVYTLLDDIGLRKICYTYSNKCGKIYDSVENMHLKIDLGRYVTIFLYGGMYADIDAFIMRPLNFSEDINNLLSKYDKENINILGLSIININPIESLFYIGEKFMINNAIMFSSPRNRILKFFINSILKKLENHDPKEKKESYNLVNNITGPISFNNFFHHYIQNVPKKHYIHLFKYYIFEPCMYNSDCNITNETIAIHKFELSWISKNIRYLIKFYYCVKKYLPIFISLFCGFIINIMILKIRN